MTGTISPISVRERPTDAITQLLKDWRQGSEAALERLMPLVYDELRRVAAAQFRRERADHTLQPTALVNELWLRLDGAATIQWEDRAHFYGIASRLMRQILVQHARRKQAHKRGGLHSMEPLADAPATALAMEDILVLDAALTQLASHDERMSRVVEMHYFGGLTTTEMAAVLQVSEATITRELRLGRARLHRTIGS